MFQSWNFFEVFLISALFNSDYYYFFLIVVYHNVNATKFNSVPEPHPLKTRSKLTCRADYRINLLGQKKRLQHMKNAMTYYFPYLVMSLQDIYYGKFQAS